MCGHYLYEYVTFNCCPLSLNRESVRVYIYILSHQEFLTNWLILTLEPFVQSAGALLLRRGITPCNECPGYDIKQSNGEAPVMLELWEMWSNCSLTSLPGPLSHGQVASDRVLSMDQIELTCVMFISIKNVYLYWTKLFERELFYNYQCVKKNYSYTKQNCLTKNCFYVYKGITYNAIKPSQTYCSFGPLIDIIQWGDWSQIDNEFNSFFQTGWTNHSELNLNAALPKKEMSRSSMVSLQSWSLGWLVGWVIMAYQPL